MLAHPLKISAKIVDASKRLVPGLPRIHQALCISPLLLTVLDLKRLRPRCVVLAQGGNVLAVERGRELVAAKEGGGERDDRDDLGPHSSPR